MLRDKISDQLLRITESSLRIGAIQDNLLTYFETAQHQLITQLWLKVPIN